MGEVIDFGTRRTKAAPALSPDDVYRQYKQAEAAYWGWCQFNVWCPVYGGADPRKVAMADEGRDKAAREMARLTPLLSPSRETK